MAKKCKRGCSRPKVRQDLVNCLVELYKKNHPEEFQNTSNATERGYSPPKVNREEVERLKELYEWGHKSKTEYLADYAVIDRELRQLPSLENDDDTLTKLALFLKNIVKAWEQATQEQRNRLLKCLFEAIWIKDKRVSAVTPRPEFQPFFELQYADMSQHVLHWRPRGGLALRLHYFRKLIPIKFEERFEFRLGLNCHYLFIFKPNLLEQAPG